MFLVLIKHNGKKGIGISFYSVYSVFRSGHVALQTHSFEHHLDFSGKQPLIDSIKQLLHILCLRSANTAEEQKSAALQRQEEHLRLATFARAKHNSLAAAVKQTATTHDLVLGPHQPNSADISFHYSFDFAQQVIIKSYLNNNNIMCSPRSIAYSLLKMLVITELLSILENNTIILPWLVKCY